MKICIDQRKYVIVIFQAGRQFRSLETNGYQSISRKEYDYWLCKLALEDKLYEEYEEVISAGRNDRSEELADKDRIMDGTKL